MDNLDTQFPAHNFRHTISGTQFPGAIRAHNLAPRIPARNFGHNSGAQFGHAICDTQFATHNCDTQSATRSPREAKRRAVNETQNVHEKQNEAQNTQNETQDTQNEKQNEKQNEEQNEEQNSTKQYVFLNTCCSKCFSTQSSQRVSLDNSWVLCGFRSTIHGSETSK